MVQSFWMKSVKWHLNCKPSFCVFFETGEYIKIGDTKPTRVNVRIIAATNRNLPEEIAAGRFREDLFYRLSVFQIHLPPLRERAGDVRLLAKAFVKNFSARLARPVTEITPAFLEGSRATTLERQYP